LELTAWSVLYYGLVWIIRDIEHVDQIRFMQLKIDYRDIEGYHVQAQFFCKVEVNIIILLKMQINKMSLNFQTANNNNAHITSLMNCNFELH